MAQNFSWNFRPTLDRLDVFFFYNVFMALSYWSDQGGLGQPEYGIIVFSLFGMVNGILLLLFLVNLVLETCRYFSKPITWLTVSVVAVILFGLEWYLFTLGFGISPAFQTYVLVSIIITVLGSGFALYCLSYKS